LKRAYVIAVIGKVEELEPAVLEQLAAEQESPILLLHSPLEVAREHRLGGFYPIPVAHEAQFCVSSGPNLPDFSTVQPDDYTMVDDGEIGSDFEQGDETR